MNDVASTSLVTVRRPPTMLPSDFRQALEDLEKTGHVDAQIIAGDHAVVEKRAVAEVPLARIAKADAADEPEVHETDDRGDRGEASRTGHVLEDARVVAAEGSDGQPTSSRPPSKPVHRVARARAHRWEVPHGAVRDDESRAVVSSDQALNETASHRAEEKRMKDERSSIEIIRTLIAEGATTSRELREHAELAHFSTSAVDVALATLRKKGEIVSTGRGEFKPANRNGGGQASYRARSSRAQGEGRGRRARAGAVEGIHGARRRRGSRLLERGRRGGARAGSREAVT